VIIADSGALWALLDDSQPAHAPLLRLFEEDPEAWRLPWAILPEVDYFLSTRAGPRAQEKFHTDLAEGAWAVEWGRDDDLRRVQELNGRYRALRLGLVDAVVIAAAERLKADAIATLDLRHFGAVEIRGQPRLFPRDLPPPKGRR
jgi:hypothetical protein